jgi:hypothetical protein
MKNHKKTNNQPTLISKNEYIAKILVGLCLFICVFVFIDHITATLEYHVGIVTNKSKSLGTNKRPEKLYLTVKIENGEYIAFDCKPEKYYATEINQLQLRYIRVYLLKFHCIRKLQHHVAFETNSKQTNYENI